VAIAGRQLCPSKPDESISSRIRQVGSCGCRRIRAGGICRTKSSPIFEKWVKEWRRRSADSAKIVSAETAKPERLTDWDKERQYWAFQKPQSRRAAQVADAQMAEDGR